MFSRIHDVKRWSRTGISEMSERIGGLERLLRREGVVVLGSLLAITVISWLYMVLLTARMAGGDMSFIGMGTMTTGAVMNMQPEPWSLATFLLMLIMWWVMMIGMMVPSAAPMILIFARAQRSKLPDENPGVRIALFTLGYLLLWLTFSIGATSLQWGLGYIAVLCPTIISSSKYLGPSIFFAAGIYQLTPLKLACLAHCRSPIMFLSSHWHIGDWGALRMGLAHGAYCVGCCWILMGLLFFGGVMNLLWIAAIAVFVLLEKILPTAWMISRLSGIGMLCFSVILLNQ